MKFIESLNFKHNVEHFYSNDTQFDIMTKHLQFQENCDILYISEYIISITYGRHRKFISPKLVKWCS